MNEGLAYWAPPDENPNFISRPPDPGVFSLLKTVGWEALYHSPFYATRRFSELTLEKSDYFNVAGRVLDPAEANQKYGLGGQLKFDEPIKEEAAQLMYRRKMDEIDRAYLISAGSTTGMRKTASFGVGMAATLLDPINVASMFIPVVGEARIARFAQQFGGSALKQRLIQGAATGTMGAAMVEPLILLPALQEQANYNLRDSAINLGFGAALGGMLHAGLGAVADRLRRVKPRDADTIFEAAMNNVLKDEPVTAPARVAEFVDELSFEEQLDRAAQSQRGAPEHTMLRVVQQLQEAGAPAVFTDLLEHIGDLSHRLQEPKFQGGAAGEKLRKLNRLLQPPEGRMNLEQEIANSIEGNAEYQVGKRHPELDDLTTRDRYEAIKEKYAHEVEAEKPKIRAAMKKLGEVYAQAHIDENLPITYAGKLGKEAAIALGKLDFDKLRAIAKELTEFYEKTKLTDAIYHDPGWTPEPTLDQIPKRDMRGRFLKKEERLAMLDQKIREEQLKKQENRGQKIGVDTQENSSRLPKDDKGITGETTKDIQTIESEVAELAKALDKQDEYYFHLDSTNAPIESFRSRGIRPSKTGYQGPGIYLAETPEATQWNGTLQDGTLYRVNRKKLIEVFGKYSSENPHGVQTGEPDNVLIDSPVAIPAELVEIKQGDRWIPLKGDDVVHPEIAAAEQVAKDHAKRAGGLQAGIQCILRNLI